MALRKCPKCELNYIKDDAQFCDVCLRAMKRVAARVIHDIPDDDEHVVEGEILMCTECGEAPAVKGSELCVECLKEHKRQIELENAATIDEEFDAVVAADEGDDDVSVDSDDM